MVFIENESSSSKPLLGEILLQRRLVTEEQLNEALSLQKRESGLIGEIFVKLGYVEEKDIVVALIVQCSLPYIAINKYEIDQRVIELIPENIAREFHVMPLDLVGNVLSVVMSNPFSDLMKERLEEITRCRIATFIATKTEIDEAIARWYKKA